MNLMLDDFFTPLQRVAKWCDAKTVKVLLDAGASLEATDRYRRTPLYHAAERHSHVVVACLLEHGANVNAKDIYSQTPLMAAIIAYGRVRGNVREHFVQTMQLILAQKDVDGKWKACNGSTALWRTKRRYYLKRVVKLLKAHGA